MSFLISDAMAAAPTTHGQADGTFSLIMIVAIFVLFYFMLIRPQNKRAKEHREMISKLKKGMKLLLLVVFWRKLSILMTNTLKLHLLKMLKLTFSEMP